MTKPAHFLGRLLGLTPEGVGTFCCGVLACALANLSFMLPIAVLYPVAAQLLAHLEDASAPLPELLPTCLACVGCLAAMVLAQFLEYEMTYVRVYEESARKRIDIAERLRRLPLSFFQRRDLSDLTGVMMKDCADQERMFMHVMPHLFGTGISTVLILAASFAFDCRLALAAFWTVPAAFAAMGLTVRAQKGRTCRMEERRLMLSADIQEFFDAACELRTNDRTDAYLDRLDAGIDSFEAAQTSSELLNGACVTAAQSLLRLGIASTIGVGAALTASGQVEFLTYLVFLLVVTRAYDPISLVLESVSELLALRLSIARTNQIADETAMVGDSTFEPRGHDITFENVSFSYSDGAKGDAALSHVSFVARQGEVCALVGPSGSGKSTCARLAARFWDADSGVVRHGGVDVSTVDPEALLGCYAEVFQDVMLFDESVMENIRLGRVGAGDDEVLAAAKAACCDEFVLRLPQGYQTRIGENGQRLSGGQRQRISIARALLKDAPVVLLDEATASLDVESETQVQRALARLLAGRTVIVVAHRVRTVLEADHVVVLDAGRVVEQGSPAELLGRPGGMFAHMARLQGCLQDKSA